MSDEAPKRKLALAKLAAIESPPSSLLAASEQQDEHVVSEPVVRYHVEKNGEYLSYDRHADYDDWFGSFENAFVLRFDSVKEALPWAKRYGARVVVSVDGKLV